MAYTAPSTWVAGNVLTAAQLNQQIRDNLLAAFPLGVDAWTGYTPTLTQPGAITKTVTRAVYHRVGRLIVAQIRLAVTGAGTLANEVLLGLPVTAGTSTGVVAGNGWLFDASTTTMHWGSWTLVGTGAASLIGPLSTGNGWGVSPSLALASGDSITATLMYEAAT